MRSEADLEARQFRRIQELEAEREALKAEVERVVALLGKERDQWIDMELAYKSKLDIARAVLNDIARGSPIKAPGMGVDPIPYRRDALRLKASDALARLEGK